MTELPESAPDLSTEALTQRLETAMFSGRTISVLGLLQIGVAARTH
jgi:hypothetical protein